MVRIAVLGNDELFGLLFIFFLDLVILLLSDVKSLKKRKGEEMSQRKSVNGRPSGTDGSDFSFRMVVDSSMLSFKKFDLLSRFSHVFHEFCEFRVFGFLY